MFTVMLWKNKDELRVVRNSGEWRSPTHAKEFVFLPEHAGGAPTFATAEEGWDYIRHNYPHLQP